MKRPKRVARTASEADERGHEPLQQFSLKKLSAAKRNKGAHLSSDNAKPGDIAWVGPCENGSRIVCYYDENMNPSDCRNQPC
jgi:hypothetical protein